MSTTDCAYHQFYSPATAIDTRNNNIKDIMITTPARSSNNKQNKKQISPTLLSSSPFPSPSTQQSTSRPPPVLRAVSAPPSSITSKLRWAAEVNQCGVVEIVTTTNTNNNKTSTSTKQQQSSSSSSSSFLVATYGKVPRFNHNTHNGMTLDGLLHSSNIVLYNNGGFLEQRWVPLQSYAKSLRRRLLLP